MNYSWLHYSSQVPYHGSEKKKMVETFLVTQNNSSSSTTEFSSSFLILKIYVQFSYEISSFLRHYQKVDSCLFGEYTGLIRPPPGILWNV